MQTNPSWFTEIFPEGGSSFGLKVKTKLHEEQSPYQLIEIYDTDTYGKLMVIDGCVMLTTRDNFLYHEMMSHTALFTHQNPQKVVIIGGGDCGTLKEVLKHKEVTEAWQVEIDERVTRIAEKYFPELCEANNDPRAHFYFGDGIKWMAEVKANSCDVIIIDSTDPVGPAAGLFTKSFYENCFRALRSGGILIQQSESPLYHLALMKEMHTAMQQAGFDHTYTLPFPQPCYPSGWWSATMAGKGIHLDQFREGDALHKNFATQYYNAAIHYAALAQPEFMRKVLSD